MRTRTNVGIAGVLAALSPAMAQSNIDVVNKFSWQENCGWMNWRDANGEMDGVRDYMTHLSGFIWCENIGWINIGNGTFGGAAQYPPVALQTGSNFGINIDSGGMLSGYAWGENVGWIYFGSWTNAAPGFIPRIDLFRERLRGFVWGENIGWVNLDLPTTGQFAMRTCYANCDGSSVFPTLTANDFQCFLNRFVASDPRANCDRSITSPVLTANDFQCFLDRYVAGCP